MTADEIRALVEATHTVWAKYRGSWAYVVGVRDDDAMLAGWRGIKTTMCKVADLTDVRESAPKSRQKTNPYL